MVPTGGRLWAFGKVPLAANLIMGREIHLKSMRCFGHFSIKVWESNATKAMLTQSCALTSTHTKPHSDHLRNNSGINLKVAYFLWERLSWAGCQLQYLKRLSVKVHTCSKRIL